MVNADNDARLNDQGNDPQDILAIMSGQRVLENDAILAQLKQHLWDDRRPSKTTITSLLRTCNRRVVDWTTSWAYEDVHGDLANVMNFKVYRPVSQYPNVCVFLLYTDWPLPHV